MLHCFFNVQNFTTQWKYGLVTSVTALLGSTTGTVTLNFTVDENGAVKDSAIVKSSGHPALDEAARSGIAKCRFKNGPGNTNLQYVWVQEHGK